VGSGKPAMASRAVAVDRAIAPEDRGGEVVQRGVLIGAGVVLAALIGYPLAWIILGSFGLPHGLSLSHFADVFGDESNFLPLLNTLLLAAATAVGAVILGVPMAWAVARTDVPFKGLIRGLVAIGFIMPPYITAVAYIILMGPNAGHLNRWMAYLFHVPRGPFNIFSMGGVIFVIILHAYAFTFFFTDSALQSMDGAFEEAAQILGASRWRVTLRITLPLVLPAISGAALIAAIISMALFGPQAILGLPANVIYLPTRIYGILGSYPPDYNGASALSIVLILLTVIGLYLQRKSVEQRSHVVVSGKTAPVSTIRLGWLRFLLLAFCLVVTLFSVVLPLFVLVSAAFSKSWVQPLSPANFTLANFHAALIDDQVASRGTENSLLLAAGAATLVTIVGLLVAYIDVRGTMKERRVLDYLAILPLGLPGTVLAVGMLQAWIRPPLILYGTIWILLADYAARGSPFAVRSANAALRQVDVSLEDAARISGASWLRTLRTVTIPLVRPSLMVGWLLVFIPSLSELSSSILLYSSGSETIGVAVFRLSDQGRFELTAAMSVFTIVVAIVALVIAQRIAGLRLDQVAAGGQG
jgi:iron(III) transport system permease protein